MIPQDAGLLSDFPGSLSDVVYKKPGIWIILNEIRHLQAKFLYIFMDNPERRQEETMDQRQKIRVIQNSEHLVPNCKAEFLGDRNMTQIREEEAEF